MPAVLYLLFQELRRPDGRPTSLRQISAGSCVNPPNLGISEVASRTNQFSAASEIRPVSLPGIYSNSLSKFSRARLSPKPTQQI
jgi:hypothetical protein